MYNSSCHEFYTGRCKYYYIMDGKKPVDAKRHPGKDNIIFIITDSNSIYKVTHSCVIAHGDVDIIYTITKPILNINPTETHQWMNDVIVSDIWCSVRLSDIGQL